jgi:hypothetical protein
MTRLYLHPLIEVGVGHFGFTILMDIASPMDFITLSIAFRWSILVVEPSPLFQDRSLAADCPIFSFFRAVTLVVSNYVVARKALRGFQQFTRS